MTASLISSFASPCRPTSQSGDTHSPIGASSPVSLHDGSFERGLAQLLPDLRRRARGLTGNAERGEDLVQDSVERALRFKESFRSGSYLRAWLMRIMQNVFISQRRRAATERRVMESAGYDPNGWAVHDTVQLLPGLSPPVEQALDALPERLKMTIQLVDIHECSYRDAAEAQEVPLGTIMSRLHRGRARLAASLKSEPVSAAA